jgi:hypothetical protein
MDDECARSDLRDLVDVDEHVSLRRRLHQTLCCTAESSTAQPTVGRLYAVRRSVHSAKRKCPYDRRTLEIRKSHSNVLFDS